MTVSEMLARLTQGLVGPHPLLGWEYYDKLSRALALDAEFKECPKPGNQDK